ncbi:unnamed protein product, partial [Pylaiella littoralis]
AVRLHHHQRHHQRHHRRVHKIVPNNSGGTTNPVLGSSRGGRRCKVVGACADHHIYILHDLRLIWI